MTVFRRSEFGETVSQRLIQRQFEKRAGVDSKVPPALFCRKFASRAGIIKKLWDSPFAPDSSIATQVCGGATERRRPMIKPIQIALAPTRSRSLNVFLGVVLALVSLLVFVALATYHSIDPSMNTSTDPTVPAVIHNWIGPLGAWMSDLMLQTLGLTAVFLPLWMGGVAWGWMRSRPGGSAILRGVGTVMTLLFVPALFALLPWHWRWLHAIAVEGVVGRLIAGLLVGWLNVQGAWLVAVVLALAGIYFAAAVSLWALKEMLADRMIHVHAWQDRWHNRREVRAEKRAERDDLAAVQSQPGPSQRIFSGVMGSGIEDD